MCIGIPMRVTLIEPGHAWCEGRGERRRVNTALVAEAAEGDWLLVFLEGAREHIDAARAAEVNAALDLLEGALRGFGAPADTFADPGFALPSAMSAAEVAALAGHPRAVADHPTASPETPTPATPQRT
jgi:hydrogenase expression/formation protein HypC